MAARSTSTARPLVNSESGQGKAARPEDVSARKPGKGGGGRRREGQGAAPPQTRKEGSQRGRVGGGRRQDPNYAAPPLSRDDEEWESELGFFSSPGSKKQNLSHLLTNFQYGPRPGGQSGGRGGRRGGQRMERQASHHYVPYKPRYDTSQYLQANCQFIVRQGGDYSKHTKDPDCLVDWSCVEQVMLKQGGTSPTACPICLYPPTAAKIAKCGHVFCWPCILHYLALSDEKTRKCPICEVEVAKDELRSAVVVPTPDVTIGSSLTLVLMSRARDSLVALPVDATNTSFSSLPPPVGEAFHYRRFIKMFQASTAEVATNVLGRERRELEKQWEEEKFQPESCFIEEALQLLARRQEEGIMLEGISGRLSLSAVTAVNVDELPSIEKLELGENECMEDPFKEELETTNNVSDKQSCGQFRNREIRKSSSESDGSLHTADHLDVTGEQGGGKVVPDRREVFYFYQSEDGQPVFIHALNIAMMVEQFGSLENCPTTITATVLEKEGTSMVSEMRDRLRYLRHIPVASSFEVAELDIGYLMSPETMTMFEDQLEDRKRKRNKKKKEEQRREKRIEVEERRIMGRCSSPMARIESKFHYPVGGLELELISPQIDHVSEEIKDTGNGGAPSFALMARTQPVAPPSLPKSASSPSGWAVLGPNMAITRTRTNSDSEAEPEGYQPPPRPMGLGDALAAALAVTPSEGLFGSGKKKGKKMKGRLLNAGPPRPVL